MKGRALRARSPLGAIQSSAVNRHSGHVRRVDEGLRGELVHDRVQVFGLHTVRDTAASVTADRLGGAGRVAGRLVLELARGE